MDINTIIHMWKCVSDPQMSPWILFPRKHCYYLYYNVCVFILVCNVPQCTGVDLLKHCRTKVLGENSGNNWWQHRYSSIIGGPRSRGLPPRAPSLRLCLSVSTHSPIAWLLGLYINLTPHEEQIGVHLNRIIRTQSSFYHWTHSKTDKLSVINGSAEIKRSDGIHLKWTMWERQILSLCKKENRKTDTKYSLSLSLSFSLYVFLSLSVSLCLSVSLSLSHYLSHTQSFFLCCAYISVCMSVSRCFSFCNRTKFLIVK